MNILGRCSLVLFAFTIGGWIQPFVLGCAHTAHVVAGCKAEITAALTNRVAMVLAGEDYEVQLAILVADTALCAVREAVKEVIASQQNDPKMAKSAGAKILTKHGEAWLLAHPL